MDARRRGARRRSTALGEGKVSFNDIMIKATALALKQHPACNAWWQDDHIRYWNDVHVGMAVAVEDGLITPVIRHADRKTLREIGAEAQDLAGRARERKLKPEEYTGGTFSVSNLGMFDIDEFTAIINPPEAGILAVGRDRADQAGGARGPGGGPPRGCGSRCRCDHRVIDGATGAQFLKTLKRMLENPLAHGVVGEAVSGRAVRLRWTATPTTTTRNSVASVRRDHPRRRPGRLRLPPSARRSSASPRPWWRRTSWAASASTSAASPPRRCCTAPTSRTSSAHDAKELGIETGRGQDRLRRRHEALPQGVGAELEGRRVPDEEAQGDRHQGHRACCSRAAR